MINKTDKVVNNIFTINLGVKKTEKVLIITDNFNNEIKRISKLFFETGKRFTSKIKHVEYPPTGCHGTEPPEEVWAYAFGENVYKQLKKEKLFKPLLTKRIKPIQIEKVESIVRTYKREAVDVVIALSYFSTSHTRFRDILNRLCGTRYASMPLFDEQMLRGAMRVNWEKMLKRSKEIARIVNRYDEIEIKTPNGTFITFSKEGRKAQIDSGIITKRGSFSNLPAGEVYLAPLEGTAKGKIVLEWAPTRKLKSPVILYIEKGIVQKIEGNERFADYLKEKLYEKRENRNIAELGIGTNDRASRADNILESEKIYGTIHIALGDNSSFGGKVRTSFHQDFVFFKPTVTLASGRRNRVLFKDGKLVKEQ
jgi:leucyl aminopeptidase (aminopeptidase T)